MATVLVVEDDAAVRGLLALTLETEGYEVATAEDGAEAVATASRLLPDAILLDLVLPEMDGSEVVAHLRSDVSTRDIPVILMSAMHGAVRNGAPPVTGNLSKPFQIDRLLAVLAEALRQETSVAAR
jgi:two-component system OmpR family response regulator